MLFQKLIVVLSCCSLLAITDLHAESATDFVNSQKAEGKNLTDEEQIITETFIHEGKTQREMQEECSKSTEMQKACQGRDVNPETAGISGGMMRALTKAYTMVVGAMAANGGGGLTMVDDDAKDAGTDGKDTDSAKADTDKADTDKADAKDADAKDGDASDKDKDDEQDDTDYCQYIAVGTEAVALFQQTQAQENLGFVQEGQETAQKEALYKASRSHGERAKNAKFQAGGWGVTTACYAAMMARPSVSKSSITNWLKLGAAGLLTAFFADQATEHEKYEKKVKALADRLPGVGDCNPVTDNDCYCAQPETQNDPKHCLPQLHNRVIAQNSFRVACTDNKMKADPKCVCNQTNSCLDTEITRKLQGTATDLNSAMSASFLKPFKALANGELKSGSVSGSALGLVNKARRESDRAAKELDKKDNDVSILVGQQKEEFDALKGLGISSGLARKLAKTPLSNQAKKNTSRFNGKFKGSSSNKRFARRKGGTKVLTFGRSSGRVKKRNKKKYDNPFAKFGRKKKKNKRKQASVLKFGKENRRAMQAAQVDRRKDAVIFDIISHRYQKSGRQRLGIK